MHSDTPCKLISLLLVLLRRIITVNKVFQMFSNNSSTFTKETYGMTGMIRVDLKKRIKNKRRRVNTKETTPLIKGKGWCIRMCYYNARFFPPPGYSSPELFPESVLGRFCVMRFHETRFFAFTFRIVQHSQVAL